MPAKLELFPRKTFALTLSDNSVVEGQFGTWALARFGQRKKMSLAQIIQLFDEPTIMDMLEFVLCAIEYKEREAGKPPLFNDIKLSKWIDEYAFESGEAGVLMKLMNHSNSEEKLEMPPEKKTEEKNLHGVTSSGTSLLQEVQ